MQQLKLGFKVRDMVSGVVGIVGGISVYLNGCVSCMVVPWIDKDGKKGDNHWIDLERLEVLNMGEVAPKLDVYVCNHGTHDAEEPAPEGGTVAALAVAGGPHDNPSESPAGH